jgi:hypothetical protein
VAEVDWIVAVSFALMAASKAWCAVRSVVWAVEAEAASVVKMVVACSTCAGVKESSVVYRVT